MSYAPARRREYERERYQNDEQHRNRVKQYARAYYERNRDQLREQARKRMAERRITDGDAVRAQARERTRKYRADPTKSSEITERARVAHRIKVYNLPPEEYQRLLERQGGRCAICRRNDRALGVDHDHATGRVRGLLCNSCNTAIGHLNDDPVVLAAAIAYLTLKEAA
jgi:hypothetical protein